MHERLATDFQASTGNKNILKSFLLGLLTVFQCMIDMNPIKRSGVYSKIFKSARSRCSRLLYVCKLPSEEIQGHPIAPGLWYFSLVAMMWTSPFLLWLIEAIALHLGQHVIMTNRNRESHVGVFSPQKTVLVLS